MEKNASIVVTGSNGLVGSSLMEQLRLQGYTQVHGLTREHCDLLNRKETESFFLKSHPKYVFHTAAKVYGIMGNMKNKALSFFDNILINTHVIHASHLVNVKKITVMGTGAIYPFPTDLPLREEMIFSGRPHPAEDSYAQAKRAMLAMLEAYEESYGLKWAYIVSCNLFGPRDKFDTEWGHVIPALIKKFYLAKKSGGKVEVWGNGSAKRDFMYVKDAAKAALSIMENLNGPVNIGSGVVYPIHDIVEMIAEITDMKDRVIWDSSKPNGQAHRAYELSKICSIGFKCDFTIRQGLEETWNWYIQHHV